MGESVGVQGREMRGVSGCGGVGKGIRRQAEVAPPYVVRSSGSTSGYLNFNFTFLRSLNAIITANRLRTRC